MSKFVEIPENDAMDAVLSWMRSPKGHVFVISIMAFMTSSLSVHLFGQAIIKIYDLGFMGYALGFCFAFGMEFGIFFLAVNGYKKESWTTAAMSVIILSATFAQLPLQDMTFEVARWVMCIFPPLMIALISHKLALKYEWKARIEGERIEKETEHVTNVTTVTNGYKPLVNGIGFERLNGTKTPVNGVTTKK